MLTCVTDAVQKDTWGGGGGGDDGGCRSDKTHVSTIVPRFLIGTTSVTCFGMEVEAFLSLVLPCFGVEVAVFLGLQDHTVRLNLVSPLHSREQHPGVEGGGQLPQGGNNSTECTCAPARNLGPRGKHDHTRSDCILDVDLEHNDSSPKAVPSKELRAGACTCPCSQGSLHVIRTGP